MKAFFNGSAGATMNLKKSELVGTDPLDGPTTPLGHTKYDSV